MSNPYVLPVILFLVGLAAILATLELYRILRSENQNLRRDVCDMKSRIIRLEEASIKRVNYQTLEEIEHAMAELAVLDTEHNLRGSRIASIREHLSKAHTPNNRKG